jgi:tetratricopeptide (TPR) repeat protein
MGPGPSLDSPYHRVKRNLARANGYLRRKEYRKAVQAAAVAFSAKPDCAQLVGQHKHELEFLCIEFCDNFNTNPGVIAFMHGIKIRARPFLAYAPGGEDMVRTKLEIVEERMDAKEREREARRLAALAEKKATWMERGQRALDEGNYPRGKAWLRRVVDDFGHEPGVLADIGSRLLDKDLLPEAADILARARGADPRDHTVYTLAIRAYQGLGEMGKAEEVYLAAIRQFGGHPLTYLNLARHYMAWRKRDKAYEYARKALEADPGLDEAREIVRRTG